MIAALIATRGWLMSEEQVMKKMSQWYTILVSVLLFLILGISLTSNYSKYEENCCSEKMDVVNDSIAVMPVDTIFYQENDESKISVSVYNFFLK